MNIAFVNYHHFESNSAVHIFNLANALVAMGHHCAVIVPHSSATVDTVGAPRFQCLDYAEALAGGLDFPDGRGPSLIHAWTPRERVREIVEELAQHHQCPYFVHLEDNEELLACKHLGITWAELTAFSVAQQDAAIGTALSHPLRYPIFLAGAAGVTVIVDRLFAFKPDEVPGMLLWPAFEDDLFAPRPPDMDLRRSLRIPDDNFVVVYNGNAHVANVAEMRSLYIAIAAVNRRGIPVTLVRTGTDYTDFLGSDLSDLQRYVVNVGRLEPRHETVPRYLALADVLVQPGRADEFNEYRFPSKLPEFFGMGKPVILPKSNIGHHIRDGIDGILLHEGSAIEIAEKLEMLLRDPGLRNRLGLAARAFAETNFNWHKSAERLVAFYGRHAWVNTSAPLPVLQPMAEFGGVKKLDALLNHNRFSVSEGISYATVEDYSDSKRHLPQFASIASDLKDVQRPWCVKAILSKLPRGSHLLEIGGGDPWVANFLTKLGYKVWLIDPYEGLGNGPTDFDVIRDRYPDVNFIRGWFPRDLNTPPDKKFDAIYSISVLEHVPQDQIQSVVSAIPDHLREGGWNIHAVDHVTHGRGAEWHRAALEITARGFGIADGGLDRLLSQLNDDPDTYYLSADGHNLWRGDQPYQAFPMRRCVSIQFCLQPDRRKR